MPQPNHNGAAGVPGVGRGIAAVKSFNDGVDAYFPERNLRITGITKLSGVATAGVKVVLIETPTNIGSETGTSGTGGAYVLPIPKGYSQSQTTTWRVDAYLPGSPDKAGTTLNTLQGA